MLTVDINRAANYIDYLTAFEIFQTLLSREIHMLQGSNIATSGPRRADQ